MPETLRYKELDNVLYIQAEGHVTASLCADLRTMVFTRFDGLPTVVAVNVDLSACSYMDSTFMGLLVGFNKRLAKIGAGRLRIIQPTTQARELIEGLGLLPLVEIVDEQVSYPDNMDNIIKTTSTGADLLLKAHENLMELSEENKRRFATLHSVLKSQVGTGTKK